MEGAVTSEWDEARSVISKMGDRFVLIRPDSTVGRLAAGRQALANTGREQNMRAELGEAIAGVLSTVDASQPQDLLDHEVDLILNLANMVTHARTAVDFDYRGEVVEAHAPEMPTLRKTWGTLGASRKP